ncbi:MAG: hypothetical protein JRJ84_15890, partial [Deltaproteobacteria bacterium]|nr:hypothetical protein [Deltaproteobacteria bacterium]
WFGARDYYQMSNDQVFYKNPDSGVYWTFDFSEEDGERVPVALNLNYFRPDIFALEAVEDVAAFVDAFGLEVEDPQVEGMGEGPFTVEVLTAAIWSEGMACALPEVDLIIAINEGEASPRAIPPATPSPSARRPATAVSPTGWWTTRSPPRS